MLLLLSYLSYFDLPLSSKTKTDIVNRIILANNFLVGRTKSLSLFVVIYHILWKRVLLQTINSLNIQETLFGNCKNTIWNASRKSLNITPL